MSIKNKLGMCARTLLAAVLVTSLQSIAAAAPILVGQSASMSGGSAASGKDARAGINAYFTAVNRKGGIGGRALELISEDDEGKRDKTLTNTKNLVENRNVIALLGFTSGAGVESSLQYLAAAKTVMLSPLTGNVAIRENFNRYLFHTRAGYTDEIALAVKQLRANGLSRYAIVYLEDAKLNGETMRVALAKEKLKPILDIALDRNATDFSTQIASISTGNIDAVMFITNGAPFTKFVSGLRKLGFNGQLITSSFAGTRFVQDAKKDAAGAVVVQVLPPLSKDFLPIVRDFKAHLKEFDATAKPNITSFEAYISARVLVEALQRTKGDVSREAVVRALEGFGTMDLGGYEIKFTSTNHDGSKFVDTSVVARDGSLRY